MKAVEEIGADSTRSSAAARENFVMVVADRKYGLMHLQLQVRINLS